MSPRAAWFAVLALAGLAPALAGCGQGFEGDAAGGPAVTVTAPEGPASPRPARDISFSFGGRIYLMSPDGRLRRRLTGGRFARRQGIRQEADVQPAWSPDGKRLAFVRTSAPSPEVFLTRLYLLDPNTGDPHPITQARPKEFVSDPSWSPDGSRIAFARVGSRDGRNVNEIVVIDSDGGGERVVDSEPEAKNFAHISQPAWSPDGKHIIYTRTGFEREYYFSPSLYVMDADGGDPRLLVSNGSDAAWSPDGSQIAFSSVRDRNGKWCYDECTYMGELYVMDSDGSDLVRLTRNRGNDGSPSWSPDGLRIAFQSNRNALGDPPGEGTEIYSIGSDGSCLTWLTNGAPSSRDAAWRGVPGSSSDPGRCGPARRRPLVGVDLRGFKHSHRPVPYWLGRRYGDLLLGYTANAAARRGLRSFAFIYDDCSRYNPRDCPHGLQLQETSVCGRATLGVVVGQANYQGGARFWAAHGLLLLDIGQGDLSAIIGGTEVRIFPEAGHGRIRPQLLAAVSALRRVGGRSRPLPAPALPRSLLRGVARTERAYRRLGSVVSAARSLGITAALARRRLRLARAVHSLPAVRAISCPRH